MRAEDMATAQSAFASLVPLARELAPFWHAGQCQFRISDISFTLITGDARKRLPAWEGKADAWYLDGFSPAKNPEMWGDALLAEVGRHTAAPGTCATYTAAGHVRRALGKAGFAVTRDPGYGRKRHMTRGVLKP